MTTSNSTKKTLTIVGGGSAGWMTALYLQRYFHQQGVQIHLIESDKIGPIGVGEATVHSIRFLFAALGLDEQELMRETNATLKLGILFRNWMKPSAAGVHEYFHPFEQQRPAGAIDISSEWVMGQHFNHQRYDQGVCLSSLLAEKSASPKTPMSRPYQGVVPYGYHLDATLLGQFLRKKGLEAGITYQVATVTNVNVEDGEISSLQTSEGVHQADFYIDCSGFSGKLIDALQPDNWESFTDVLPCNKAVAIQRDYAPGETPRPFTTSTALSHGWAWQIDLVNRQGNGYVYDGNRLSAEQAEAELREFLGDEAATRSALHLDMKVGFRPQSWVGNCVAIGLSSGFIEPLESTGLHLINVAARLFATHFSAANISDSVRRSFNRQMRGVYEDLKQFIVLHYCLTDRDDTDFWRQAQASAEGCEGLAEKLTLWKHKVCEFMDLSGGYSTTFNDENYRYILYGMGHLPALHLQPSSTQNQSLFDQVNHMAANLLLQTQSHLAYLQHLHGKPLFSAKDTRSQ
ncbi:tryptophan halogenase family protein [Bowmanella sp. JS7-9]|uniref:tryptophan halogenase family protein n=1 Tax=Alteromonadaceae TaxID=72275 RepID=UPI00103BDF1C|nr:tryptophan halogenase family protein [Bowmanella sp. JS7-9]TBX23659.1 tryptophan halogenase [Bowmanella sp. JS7-9]